MTEETVSGKIKTVKRKTVIIVVFLIVLFLLTWFTVWCRVVCKTYSGYAEMVEMVGIPYSRISVETGDTSGSVNFSSTYASIQIDYDNLEYFTLRGKDQNPPFYVQMVFKDHTLLLTPLNKVQEAELIPLRELGAGDTMSEIVKEAAEQVPLTFWEFARADSIERNYNVALVTLRAMNILSGKESFYFENDKINGTAFHDVTKDNINCYRIIPFSRDKAVFGFISVDSRADCSGIFKSYLTSYTFIDSSDPEAVVKKMKAHEKYIPHEEVQKLGKPNWDKNDGE